MSNGIEQVYERTLRNMRFMESLKKDGGLLFNCVERCLRALGKRRLRSEWPHSAETCEVASRPQQRNRLTNYETDVPSGAPRIAGTERSATASSAAETPDSHQRRPARVETADDIWTFDYNDSADDYTAQEPRMVHAYDGKDCVAILPDKQLSKRLQAAVSDHRRAKWVEDRIDAELAELDDESERICTRIRGLEVRIAPSESQGLKGDHEELIELRQELAELHRRCGERAPDELRGGHAGFDRYFRYSELDRSNF